MTTSLETELITKTDEQLTIAVKRFSDFSGAERDAVLVEVGRRNGYADYCQVAPTFDVAALGIDTANEHYVAGFRRGTRDARSDENGEF